MAQQEGRGVVPIQLPVVHIFFTHQGNQGIQIRFRKGDINGKNNLFISLKQ